MTAKRYKKLLMATGVSRDLAEASKKTVRKAGLDYATAFAAWAELWKMRQEFERKWREDILCGVV